MRIEFDSAIMEGTHSIMSTPLGYLPYEYTGPRDELMACRETAWLGVHLNVTPVYDVFGPDAVQFLNYVCVNRDYAKLKENASRHALICNDKGQMLADGVIMKIADNHYRTYWMAPVIQFYLETSNLSVEGKYVSDEEYFFQIDGPKSLEIMEKACQCDLHDLRFGRNKKVKINGTDMVVHRLGMSGSLGYEVHGPAEHADMVYRTIREAGQEFGIRPLGSRHYCVNHTQAGYPNQFIHFYFPYFTSGEELANFFSKIAPPPVLKGSCVEDEENYYVTPYDVGWGYLVNFDHDFLGKESLEKIDKNPPRKPVTLEWNTADVSDVYASQFSGTNVEPMERIDTPLDFMDAFHEIPGGGGLYASKVLVDGKQIGIASGRINDYYHRRVISLAFIDKEYAVDGEEVIVLWGTPGTPQKEIRAKIAAFPYYNEEYRNETFDTEAISHPKF